MSVLTAVVLSGCAVGPNFRPRASPAGAAFGEDAGHPTASAPVAGGQAQRFGPGAPIPGRWWTAFGSSAVDDWVQEALKANPDLQATEAALRAARETAAAQRGTLLPQLGLGLGSMRERDSSTLSPTLASSVPLFTLTTAQVSISYTLDPFGGLRRQLESLLAQADAQRFQFEAAYLMLVSNTVNAAIAQASATTQLALTRQLVQGEQRSLRILQMQYRLGAVGMPAVEAQQAAVAQDQALLPGLEQQLKQQRDLLAALTGRLPGQLPASNLDLDALNLPRDLPLSLPSLLVVQRPDVQLAAAELHAATAQVGVTDAALLPNIALTADAGSATLGLAHLLSPMTRFWSLGAALSQTLFAGGSLENRRRAAVASMDQAGAQYRSAVLQAFRQVADALAAVQADAQTLAAQARAVNAAAGSLATARRNVALGAASDLDLLQAQRSYREAIIGETSARAARLADTVALFQALGGGWWSTDAPSITRTTER